MANELILIIEDNEKNRKLVRVVLTFKGYEVIEAETGEEGVRLAQARRPSRADRTTRGIPIMAMTASVMTEERQTILGAGFDACQGKPIKVKDFVAAVEQLLEHGRT